MNRLATSYFILGALVGSLATVVVFTSLSNRAGSSSGATPVKALKLSHTLDQSHPVHAGMEFMRDRLLEISGGALEIEIYPNGQLGTETETIEQVQRGVLAMVKPSVAPMEAFVPEMGVFGLPYLFRDEAHYWEVLNGEIGRELLEQRALLEIPESLFHSATSQSRLRKRSGS